MKTKPSGNFIGADFAYLDRRSVHAMLHGYGDGREIRYQKFFAEFSRNHPNADIEELIAAYARSMPAAPTSHVLAFGRAVREAVQKIRAHWGRLPFLGKVMAAIAAVLFLY